ncbi:MAG: hypothetical protein ACYTGN_01755 [Planctomycetota bacterium]
MKASRFLTPLLAGATIVLISANAVPTIGRKHRLEQERRRVMREYEAERARATDLMKRVHAVQHDRFYLERRVAETYRTAPPGATRFQPIKSRD